jgi:hypothetical protein
LISKESLNQITQGLPVNTSIILAILAGLGSTLAYLDYNRVVLNGKTKPNGATWAVFSAISLVSTSSYFAASGDFWKSTIPFVNVVLCIGTFVLTLVKGKFSKLDGVSWCVLIIGIVAAVVWKFTTATYGNMISQGAIIIGFIPTWRGVWQNPSRENPRPWWTWSVSYAIAGTVVILRWRHQWIDLLYPGLCIFTHALVPLVGMASKAFNLQPKMRGA